MSAISLEYFSAVDYIHDLRQADFTERQAEAVTKIIERQTQIIQEQKNDIDKQKHQIDSLTSKELATKGDISLVRGGIRETELRLQKEIETLRHETLRFVIWTGVGVVLTLIGTLGGMIAHGFHWW